MSMKFCKVYNTPLGRNGAARDELSPRARRENGDGVAVLPTPESQGFTPQTEETQTEETQAE